MKNELFHTGNSWLNLISILILLLPIIALAFKKNTWNLNFIFLIGCYVFLLCISLANNGFLQLEEKTKTILITMGIIFQAPLIMLFLTYFTKNPEFKRAHNVSLLIYLIGGTLLLAFKGINAETISIIIGTGLFLVLIFGLVIFFSQIKNSIQKRRETGKAFIISAVVFAYACYLIIYLMNFVFEATEKNEITLLFQIATIVSTLLLSIGILINTDLPEEKSIEKPVSKIPMLTEWEEYSSSKN
jgi:hypothetical protein